MSVEFCQQIICKWQLKVINKDLTGACHFCWSSLYALCPCTTPYLKWRFNVSRKWKMLKYLKCLFGSMVCIMVTSPSVSLLSFYRRQKNHVSIVWEGIWAEADRVGQTGGGDWGVSSLPFEWWHHLQPGTHVTGNVTHSSALQWPYTVSWRFPADCSSAFLRLVKVKKNACLMRFFCLPD